MYHINNVYIIYNIHNIHIIYMHNIYINICIMYITCNILYMVYIAVLGWYQDVSF